MSATELFCLLYKNINLPDLHWWPGFGEFEVVVGTILIQNTKWQRADLALQNLRQKGLLSLEKLGQIDENELAELIKDAGFYNIKAKRLKTLVNAVLEDFGDFENFKENVSREWLIAIKGIGLESVDDILCYACERDIMVVDSYSLRILGYLGYEFESYDEASEWLMSVDFDEIRACVGNENLSENTIFCAFHGLIDEFCKEHFKKGKFDEKAQEILNILK